MDDVTAFKTEAKTPQLPPGGWAQSHKAHKPRLLHVNRWHTNQPKEIKVHVTHIYFSMVSDIMGSFYHTDMHPSVNFSDNFLVIGCYKNGVQHHGPRLGNILDFFFPV